MFYYIFIGSSDGKESACHVEDLDSIPGSGRSPRERNDNPFSQYSCLENSMDRGAWQTTAHGVTKEAYMTECLAFSLSLTFIQFSSFQLCPTPFFPMNHSTPGLPVHHQLPEFIQTHVHRVRDAIQPSHPPFPPAPNPSQHQSFPMNQLLA